MEVFVSDLYCNECSLQFDGKHIFDVHFKKPFMCEYCKAGFSENVNMTGKNYP